MYRMYSENEIKPKVNFWKEQGKTIFWIKAYLMWYLCGNSILSDNEIKFCVKTLQLNH